MNDGNVWGFDPLAQQAVILHPRQREIAPAPIAMARKAALDLAGGINSELRF
jgi:hypothetical protein